MKTAETLKLKPEVQRRTNGAEATGAGKAPKVRVSAPPKFHSLGTTLLAFCVLLLFVGGLATVAIYTEQAIYISILAFGLAMALQKYVAGYFGFFVMTFTRMFNVGDRIRIGNIKGDVRRIGLFHFVLEEVGEDEKLGGELTGRIFHIPNLIVLDQPVLNYSKSYSAGHRLQTCHYIFDEIRIPLTLQSNIEAASEVLERILTSVDQRFIEEAKEAFRSSYPDFLKEAEQGNRILIHVEPKYLWLKGKFVSPVKTRNQLKSQVLLEFIKQIKARQDIALAS